MATKVVLLVEDEMTDELRTKLEQFGEILSEKPVNLDGPFPVKIVFDENRTLVSKTVLLTNMVRQKLKEGYTRFSITTSINEIHVVIVVVGDTAHIAISLQRSPDVYRYISVPISELINALETKKYKQVQHILSWLSKYMIDKEVRGNMRRIMREKLIEYCGWDFTY